MQGPAERTAAAEKVRLEQGAAAAAARREQMAAAAEARMRALSLASQQQQLWCRPTLLAMCMLEYCLHSIGSSIRATIRYVRMLRCIRCTVWWPCCRAPAHGCATA